MGAHTHTPTHTPCHHTIWTHLCRVAVYCGIIKASLNHEQPLIKAGNGGRDCDVCMIGIVRMCGWGGGGHKIYTAFTAERVVKCNYGGGEEGPTHCRAATQRADWQEGEETSDQGLFIPAAASLVLPSSASVQLRLIRQPNELELQCKQLDTTAFTTMRRGRPAGQTQTDGRKHGR